MGMSLLGCRCKCICICMRYLYLSACINSISVERTAKIAKGGKPFATRCLVLCFTNLHGEGGVRRGQLTVRVTKREGERATERERDCACRVFGCDSGKYVFNAYNYFQQAACEIKIKLRRSCARGRGWGLGSRHCATSLSISLSYVAS